VNPAVREGVSLGILSVLQGLDSQQLYVFLMRVFGWANTNETIAEHADLLGKTNRAFSSPKFATLLSNSFNRSLLRLGVNFSIS
jgi:hypothetical protein